MTKMKLVILIVLLVIGIPFAVYLLSKVQMAGWLAALKQLQKQHEEEKEVNESNRK